MTRLIPGHGPKREIALILARGYLRLAEKRRNMATFDAAASQKKLDVLLRQSPHGERETAP